MSPARWLKSVLTSTNPDELAVAWDVAVEAGLACEEAYIVATAGLSTSL